MLERIALGVLREFAVECSVEGDLDLPGRGRVVDREPQWPANQSQSLEAAIMYGGGLPAAQAGNVHMPVVRIEPAAHCTGEVATGQVDHRALGLV